MSRARNLAAVVALCVAALGTPVVSEAVASENTAKEVYLLTLRHPERKAIYTVGLLTYDPSAHQCTAYVLRAGPFITVTQPFTGPCVETSSTFNTEQLALNSGVVFLTMEIKATSGTGHVAFAGEATLGLEFLGTRHFSAEMRRL
jgi:hypothetical protein